jgi:hypothetical protein
MKRLLGVALCWVFAAALQDGPRVSFGLTTQAVVLNVAVLDGDAAVTGLGLDDFEVFDNGVRQTLKAVDNADLPIDLRLVFDISGSISERDLTSYLRAMEQVTAALEPVDRCEIITFWSRIADAASRQSPPVTIALPRGGPFGTAFFDAASLAMVTVPTPDRRSRWRGGPMPSFTPCCRWPRQPRCRCRSTGCRRWRCSPEAASCALTSVRSVR